MDERIDIVDTNGVPTGATVLKSEAHRKGLLHQSVHIWLYNLKGEILIQKRNTNKDVYPNYWDVSVAGHIGAGENVTLAAVREIEEEIGLIITAEDLIPVEGVIDQKTHANGIIDHEYHHVFFCELKEDRSNLTLQQEEVAEIRWIHFEQLARLIQKEVFVPHPTLYIDNVIDMLKTLTRSL